MPRLAIRFVALLTTVTLAGCSYTGVPRASNSPTNSSSGQLSGSVAPNSTTPAQQSTKATGTPKTTRGTAAEPAGAWSKSTAATRLRAYVSPPQKALNTLSAMSPNAPIGQAQQALSNLAGALSTMISELKAGSWPSSATATITALASAATHERDVIAQLASASSIAAMQQHSSELAAALGAEESAMAAAKVALGLPAK
jgi:hypothetical protein